MNNVVRQGISMTSPQYKLLCILARAYEADRPVEVSRQTREGDKITANRRVAAKLVEIGLARWSKPDGLFLLITDTGLRLTQGMN